MYYMDTLLFKNNNRNKELVNDALDAFIPFWDSFLSDARPRRHDCFTDDGETYSLELEMAGFGKKDVTLEVSEGKYLVVKGSKKVGEKERKVTERFALPTKIDLTKTEASLKDGLLTFKVEKASETKPVNIDIK